MKYFDNLDIRFVYRNLRYYLPSFVRFQIFGRMFRQQKTGKYFMVAKNTKIENFFEAGICCCVGAYSYIGPNVSFGNFVMMSNHVNIIGNDHISNDVGTPSILTGRPKNYYDLKTVIEDDVWIGQGVTIMRGVTIGEGSIVGANSVITKDISPYSIHVGVPAKFIKKRFDNDKIKEHALFLQNFRETKIKLRHDRKPIFMDIVE